MRWLRGGLRRGGAVQNYPDLQSTNPSRSKRNKVESIQGGMDRGRTPAPRRPKLQSLSGPTSAFSKFRKHLLASNLQTVQEAGFTPPTQHCRPQLYLPTSTRAAGEGGKTAAAAGQCRMGESFTGRKGATRYCPGPATIYVLRPDEHHVSAFRSSKGQTGRQRRRTSCARASEDIVSVHRAERYTRISGSIEKRTLRKTRAWLS